MEDKNMPEELKIKTEIVVFPNRKQFCEKNNELILGACWWSIPTFPRNMDILLNNKIYFYDKDQNAIIRRSTIFDFGYEMDKKVVYFEDEKIIQKDGSAEWEENIDRDFFIDLDEEGISPRKQNRGYAYRWFPVPDDKDPA